MLSHLFQMQRSGSQIYPEKNYRPEWGKSNVKMHWHFLGDIFKHSHRCQKHLEKGASKFHTMSCGIFVLIPAGCRVWHYSQLLWSGSKRTCGRWLSSSHKRSANQGELKVNKPWYFTWLETEHTWTLHHLQVKAPWIKHFLNADDSSLYMLVG